MEKKLERKIKEKFVLPEMYRMEVHVEGFCATSGKKVQKKQTVLVEKYDVVDNNGVISFD